LAETRDLRSRKCGFDPHRLYSAKEGILLTKYAFRDGCCEITPGTAEPESQAKVRGNCIYCGEEREVGVRSEDLQKFKNGGYAQDCFPYLPAESREFLISGICGTCWDSMFPPEEDDE